MPLVPRIQKQTGHPRVGLGPHTSRRSAMRTHFMKKLLAKVEATLTAAAFAEERDVETARRIMAEPPADAPGDR